VDLTNSAWRILADFLIRSSRFEKKSSGNAAAQSDFAQWVGKSSSNQTEKEGRTGNFSRKDCPLAQYNVPVFPFWLPFPVHPSRRPRTLEQEEQEERKKPIENAIEVEKLREESQATEEGQGQGQGQRKDQQQEAPQAAEAQLHKLVEFVIGSGGRRGHEQPQSGQASHRGRKAGGNRTTEVGARN
jgi:hypothetical protein